MNWKLVILALVFCLGSFTGCRFEAVNTKTVQKELAEYKLVVAEKELESEKAMAATIKEAQRQVDEMNVRLADAKRVHDEKFVSMRNDYERRLNRLRAVTKSVPTGTSAASIAAPGHSADATTGTVLPGEAGEACLDLMLEADEILYRMRIAKEYAEEVDKYVRQNRLR